MWDEKHNTFHIVVGVVSLLIMVGAGFVFRNKYKQFKRYGYFGIFLMCLVGNIAILSPVGAIISVLGGRLYNPMFVGIIAALGCIVGEILAYNVGNAGGVMVKDTRTYQTVNKYMGENGFLTILLVSAIPNPVFNVSAGVAGSIEYPLHKFLLASFVGNCIQFTLLAFFGSLTKKIWKP